MTKQPLLLIIILYATTVHMSAQDYSLTKEGHLLSDSDVVSVRDIPYFYAEGNGKNVLWDFSDNISDGGTSKIWLQKDTLGRHVVMSDRDISYFRFYNDTLFYIGQESPLSKADFRQPMLCMHYPFLYGDSISFPFKAYGMYCGDHPFREQGLSTIVADASGSIVLGEDTIPNVLRVYTMRSYSVCMDIDSAALDTARLKQVIEERYDWYARGYRYPIVTTVTSTSYDNMTPLGTRQTAYCLLPDIQSQFADSVNEDIRRKDSIAATEQACANADIIHYTVSQNGGIVTINYSLDSDADITTLVSDAMGIVYRRTHVHNQSGTGYTLVLDCSGLRRGQYILYINVNGKVYSNKLSFK